LWLAGSLGFRLYLRYFNTYNAVYGSLGAVIILMLWFYLTGAAILVGGEVNSEIERAAAAAGEKDAKLPGEKSHGEKAGRVRVTSARPRRRCFHPRRLSNRTVVAGSLNAYPASVGVFGRGRQTVYSRTRRG